MSKAVKSIPHKFGMPTSQALKFKRVVLENKTQLDVSEELGMNVSTYNYIENGRMIPTEQQQQAIDAYLTL